MKHLLLLRHGSAASGTPDAARPLDARGRSEAESIAACLAGLGPAPDAALCSPARRARETAEAVLRALAPAPALRVEPALYLASPSAIFGVVGGLDAAIERALVVSHNPGLEELARELVSSAPRASEPALRRALRGGLGTGALAVFEVDADEWAALAAAPARLVALERP